MSAGTKCILLAVLEESSLAVAARRLGLADLAGHDMIGPDRNRSDLAPVDRFGADLPRVCFVLRADSHPAQIAAARAGVGIAVVQVLVGDQNPAVAGRPSGAYAACRPG
jgi:DNA-binding transcriptional LysR family regulator